MVVWKRPDSIPFPHTYLEFDGRVVRDGKVRKYWIQEITDDYIEEVVHHYITGFLADEPVCRYSKCIEYPDCQEEMAQVWRRVLKLKISIICLTKDEGITKIVGFNTLLPRFKNEPEKAIKSPITKKVISIMQFVEKVKDPFKDFNCDVYLSAMGLYVLPEYRGEGIGEKILQMREKVGKLMGFKVGLSTYSSPISIKQATKAGFKGYVTVSYADIAKTDSNLTLPGIEEFSTHEKLMYQLYD